MKKVLVNDWTKQKMTNNNNTDLKKVFAPLQTSSIFHVFVRLIVCGWTNFNVIK